MPTRHAIPFNRGLDVATPSHEAPPGTFRAVSGLVPIATPSGTSWQAPEGATVVGDDDALAGILSVGLRPVPGGDDELLCLTASALYRVIAETGEPFGLAVWTFDVPDATRRATFASVGTDTVVAVTKGDGIGTPEATLVVNRSGVALSLGVGVPALVSIASEDIPSGGSAEGVEGQRRALYGVRLAYLFGDVFGPLSAPVVAPGGAVTAGVPGYMRVTVQGVGYEVSDPLLHRGATGIVVVMTPPLAEAEALLTASWHHVATVPLRGQTTTTPDVLIKLTDALIVTRPAVRDDSLSHRSPCAGAVTSYNGRLVLGDTALRYDAPSPTNLRWASAAATTTRIGIEIDLQGGSVVLVSAAGASTTEMVGPVGVDDPRVRTLIVYRESGGEWLEVLRIPMRAAATSATAWGFPPEGSSAWTLPGPSTGDAIPVGAAASFSEHVPGRVLVSELYAADLFQARRAVRLGQGNDAQVVAFASNAQPVSTGQFGDYPLYALCADSVWAGRSGDGDVAFAAWEPLTLRVGCVGRRALALVERRVVFAAPQGVYVLDSGVLDGPTTAPLVRARAEDDLLDALGPDTAMGYVEDRSRGRRELWLSAGVLTFVYGLDAGVWTLLERQRRAFVRTEVGRVLGVDVADGRLFNERGDASAEADVFVATAPMHLDAPGVHKRLSGIAVRQGRPLAELRWKLYDRDPVTGAPVLAAYGDLSGRPDAAKIYALCREPMLVLVGRAAPGQSIEGVALDADVRMAHRSPALADVLDFEDVLWTPTYGFGGTLTVIGEDDGTVTVEGTGVYAFRETIEAVTFFGQTYEDVHVHLTPGLLGRERMTDEDAESVALLVDP